MSEPILRIEDLKTWIKGRNHYLRAVDGLNLSLYPGQTHALLGESGCGKSLTALSILNLLPNNSYFGKNSKLYFREKDLLDCPEVELRQYRGRKIGIIFQDPMTSLNPVMTVGQQLEECFPKHVSNVYHRALILLTKVGIPEPELRYQQYPHELSGGMKQRIMIALALAEEPDVLIADEPTTALDVTIQAQVLNLLKEIQRERNMAVLLITHDLGVVRQIADHVAVMYAGHIVETAPVQTFFSDPKHPYSKQLFDALPSANNRNKKLAVIPGCVPKLTEPFTLCRFKDRCQSSFAACEQRVPRWFAKGEEAGVRCHLYDPHLSRMIMPKKTSQADEFVMSAPGKEVLLEVKGLKVHFPIKKGLFKRTVGHVKAVDGVSFELHRGETLAIVGESGCGKSTVAKAVMQLIQATSGDVLYDNISLADNSKQTQALLHQDIQIIFQDPFSSLNPRLLIKDIIAEGLYAQNKLSQKEITAAVDELLVQVGLDTSVKYRYPHEFSGGQRQRIAIARALALKPKVIVCDEPTSALDVSIQAQILNLLKSLQVKLGLSYIFITHDISVVAYMADKLAVMYLGRIVEQGLVNDVLKTPNHPYTKALLASVPSLSEKQEAKLLLEGELPSPVSPPTGCHFHTRCPKVMTVCRKVYPDMSKTTNTNLVYCHLFDDKNNI